MMLNRKYSNTWKVIMDVKTNSSRTHITDIFVHHGTYLHGFARSRTVRETSYKNVASPRLRSWKRLRRRRQKDIRVENGREIIFY